MRLLFMLTFLAETTVLLAPQIDTNSDNYHCDHQILIMKMTPSKENGESPAPMFNVHSVSAEG